MRWRDRLAGVLVCSLAVPVCACGGMTTARLVDGSASKTWGQPDSFHGDILPDFHVSKFPGASRSIAGESKQTVSKSRLMVLRSEAESVIYTSDKIERHKPSRWLFGEIMRGGRHFCICRTSAHPILELLIWKQIDPCPGWRLRSVIQAALNLRYPFERRAARNYYVPVYPDFCSDRLTNVFNSDLESSIDGISSEGDRAIGLDIYRYPRTRRDLSLFNHRRDLFACSFRGSGRSIGGLLRKDQPISHVYGLLIHGLSLTMRQPSYSDSGESNDERTKGGPPIGRRFIIALACGTLFFVNPGFGSVRAGCFWRWCFAVNFAGLCCSLILLFLTGFSWSWGWWL
jgi:hypothetical protein